eukprot:COSAG01_NODE_19565_length_1003_cov_1.246681_1_plen_89_part_00
MILASVTRRCQDGISFVRGSLYKGDSARGVDDSNALQVRLSTTRESSTEDTAQEHDASKKKKRRKSSLGKKKVRKKSLKPVAAVGGAE